MSFWYRAGSMPLTYLRSLRRGLLKLVGQRREAWSFLCVLKWSVKYLIRAVRMATWSLTGPFAAIQLAANVFLW